MIVTNYTPIKPQNSSCVGKPSKRGRRNIKSSYLPVSTLIYSFGLIKVTQHQDGYIVTNGLHTIVLAYLPVLNANVLRVILQENNIDKLENEEVNVDFGNTVETQFNHQMHMAELYDAIGY